MTNKWQEGLSIGSSMDHWLTLITITLAGIGCGFTFSLTKNSVLDTPLAALSRQTIFMVVGLIIMLLVSRIDYHQLADFSYLFYGVTVVLCIIKFYADESGIIKATSHYLTVGYLNIHVSSLLFVSTCLVFGAKFNPHRYTNNLILVGIGGLSVCLLSLAFDFSQILALLLVATLFCMLIFENSLQVFATMITIASLLAATQWKVVSSINYFSKYIDVWLDPFSDPSGYGYETIQNLYAIASGGLIGVGYGMGIESYFSPISTRSENVLAGISQEIGLLGASVVLLLLFLWALRAIVVALHSPDHLGFYLAAIIALRFLVLVLLHTLSAVNAVPRMNLLLPFISYGRSQLIIDFFLSGIVLSISRFQDPKNSKDERIFT